MLFQIEGTEVYFVASIHFGKQSFYPFSTLADKACDAAKTVYFESRPTDISHLMHCPPGRTLSDCVSPAIIEKLRTVAPKAGMDFKKLLTLKPWAVALSFFPALCAREGCAETFSVERYFTKRAQIAGAQIEFLETPEEALAVFDAAPKAEMENFLARGLFHPEKVQSEVKQMMIAWQNSDIPACDRIIETHIKRFPFFEELVYGRNRKWLPKLHELTSLNTPAFVCVGILHFAGEHSLQYLLNKDHGHNVRRLE